MAQVRASHILIKHSGSRRPASWKDPQGKEIVQRSKERAIEILQSHISQLKTCDSKQLPLLFYNLAQTNSDCGSAKAGGDLGMFSRGEMQKPFEDATFSLEAGQLSGVVDTDSGVHVILRTH